MNSIFEIRKQLFTLFLGIVFVPMLDSATEGAQRERQSKDVIRYEVDLTDVRNHYVTIEVFVPVQKDTTELMMAVWTPGSYLMREYARHVDSMEITADGKPLKFEKTRKNRWLVQTKDIDSFRLKYRLYCNEMTVRTNWVGKRFAMLNGAPSYITVPGRLDWSHVVRLRMPKGWTRSATSLKSSGDTPHTFSAENFDELVDSPIVAGNVLVYPFEVGGIQHQLVNVGESGNWDGTKAATDLKRIVKAHQEMWGSIPYDRYLFLNVIGEAGGGLEHDNSTVLMTSRWTFRDSGRYKGWLSLASHEFFHTWNVRRLRPKSLVTYDYENEVYTESLWIAEGITSYYQDLALVRAGLLSRNEFVSKLSGNVEGTQRTGGRKIQSLKDSSYDAWIKYYRPDENSSNTRISYYSKGAVVAFLLDAKIRKLTKGKKSLDDLMRKMFAKYSKSGYTTQDFRKMASRVAGKDLSDWFAKTIDSTEELDYSDISAIGVDVPRPQLQRDSVQAESAPAKKVGKSKSARKAAKADADAKIGQTSESSKEPTNSNAAKSKSAKANRIAELGKQFSKTLSKVTQSSRPTPVRRSMRPWLGFSSSVSDGKVTVTGVKPESPASLVGLNIDDEILAVNGYRVTRSVESRMSRYKVNDELEFLIARRGEVMTMTMKVGELESENWRLRLNFKPSASQKRLRDQWLNGSKK